MLGYIANHVHHHLVVASVIAVILAVVVLAFAAGSVWVLSYQLINRRGEKLPRLFLIYERASDTYSLSKFQFYTWSIVILFVWCYVLFYTGLLGKGWALPDLKAIGVTFITSLITLMIAQVANVARGEKGSGRQGPHLSDLITYGGVIAPERIQQLVWTVIAGAAYAIVTVLSFPGSSKLPEIDDVLQLLMGLSAAAYAGGKLARKPGPVIDQIIIHGPTSLEIIGCNLSRTATVCLGDGLVDVPPSDVKPTDLPASTSTFTTNLSVQLNVLNYLDDVKKSAMMVRVTNDDGQIAEVTETWPVVEYVVVDESAGVLEVHVLSNNKVQPSLVVQGLTTPVHWDWVKPPKVVKPHAVAQQLLPPDDQDELLAPEVTVKKPNKVSFEKAISKWIDSVLVGKKPRDPNRAGQSTFRIRLDDFSWWKSPQTLVLTTTNGLVSTYDYIPDPKITSLFFADGLLQIEGTSLSSSSTAEVNGVTLAASTNPNIEDTRSKGYYTQISFPISDLQYARIINADTLKVNLSDPGYTRSIEMVTGPIPIILSVRSDATNNKVSLICSACSKSAEVTVLGHEKLIWERDSQESFTTTLSKDDSWINAPASLVVMNPGCPTVASRFEYKPVDDAAKHSVQAH